MNKSIINKIKGVVGIILILASIGVIYYWENFGREQFLYKDVIVFNRSIDSNTQITSDMLTTIKIEESKIVEEAIIEPEAIIGLESKHFIPKNAQLTKKYFDMPELVLDKNQFIFSIPKDWVKAFPSSLRRKDIAFFYEIKANDNPNMNYSQIVASYNNDNELQDFNNETVEIKKDVLSRKPIIRVVVAYVKDSANREVINVSGTERLDGTSKIDEIEIVITPEELELMKKSISNGNQFIIVYQ